MNDLLQFGIGIGILQALFLGIVLYLFPAKGKIASRLLAFILFITCLLMTSELVELFNWRGASLLQVTILFDILIPILLWWFAQFFLEEKERFERNDILHTLPLVFSVLLYLVLFQWLEPMEGSFSHISDSVALFVLFKLVFIVGYALSIYKMLKRVSEGQQNVPLAEKLQLTYAIYWAFALVILVSYGLFWDIYFGSNPLIDSDYTACLLMTAFVYYLTFNILKKPRLLIFMDNTFIPPKYAKSGLIPTLRTNYSNLLIDHFEHQKPFLNEKLSLQDLAEALKMSPNQLSQVINEELNKSFNDLVNEYRLREVKRKLADPTEAHKTILALAFESGFQSKASFNRIFKKLEGITPSAYRSSFQLKE